MYAYEDITNTNFNEKIKEKNVIVKFYATWCPNCKRLEKNFKKIDFDKFGVNVYKVDIEKQKQVASFYNIKVVPTTMYFKNGKIIGSITGVQTVNEIKFELKYNY